MQLKKNKLKTENDKHLFLDGKLSEYGIGLKEACHRPAPPPPSQQHRKPTGRSAHGQAGFFLADILKVVTKVSGERNGVYDCVMDYEEVKSKTGRDTWLLAKQGRKAGMLQLAQ